MSPTPTSHLSRRQCCARLLTLFGGLAAVGCATVSPQQERELGQKEAQEVERTVGLVRDRRLVEYIETIGKRLAHATDVRTPTDAPRLGTRLGYLGDGARHRVAVAWRTRPIPG